MSVYVGGTGLYMELDNKTGTRQGQDREKAFKGFKKFSGGGWWIESDYSVCPHPLLQFLQFTQFMSDRLCQVTSGYVSLRWRDGTWSSTIFNLAH